MLLLPWSRATLVGKDFRILCPGESVATGPRRNVRFWRKADQMPEAEDVSFRVRSGRRHVHNSLSFFQQSFGT